MIWIAHRGNTCGSNPARENDPEYLTAALGQGYHVEVDVWWREGVGWRLGHNLPRYDISIGFLCDDRIWCHAKDAVTLQRLLALGVNCFSHWSDQFVLTSNNFLWTYPGATLTDRSIAVLPEKAPEGWLLTPRVAVVGVCTDNIPKYRALLK